LSEVTHIDILDDSKECLENIFGAAPEILVHARRRGTRRRNANIISGIPPPNRTAVLTVRQVVIMMARALKELISLEGSSTA